MAAVPAPDPGTQQLLDNAYADARSQLKGQVPDSLLHSVPRNPAPDNSSVSGSLSVQGQPPGAPMEASDAPPAGAMPYGADVESAPPAGAEPVPEKPTMFRGFWHELGNSTMKGLAQAGKGLANIGWGAFSRAVEALPGDHTHDDEAADAGFKAIEDTFNPAIEHWQQNQDANAAQTGKGAKIVAGVLGGAAPLALGPEAYLAQGAMNTGTDSTDQNQDLKTAYTLAGVNLMANAAGMKVPFKSPNVVKRVLANGTYGAGVSAASEWLTKKFLQSGGYQEAADNVDPLDPTTLGTSGLISALFGFLEKPAIRKGFEERGGKVPQGVDLEDLGADVPPQGAQPVPAAPSAAEVERPPPSKEGGASATPGAAVPDKPTAEPLPDLKAQIADMKDPATARKAVYLAPDNVKELGPDGIAELATGAKQIRNFDKKGGVLIVPDVEGAKAARALRSSEPDMQKVLGQLTGAGDGKTTADTAVVQGHTPEGAVATEAAVRPEEVPNKVAEVAREGKTPVVMTPEEAIQRREQGVQQTAAVAPEAPPAGAEPVPAPEAPAEDLSDPNARAQIFTALKAGHETAAGRYKAAIAEMRAAGVRTRAQIDAHLDNPRPVEKPTEVVNPESAVDKAPPEKAPEVVKEEPKTSLAKTMADLTEREKPAKGRKLVNLKDRMDNAAAAGSELKQAAKDAQGKVDDAIVTRANQAANAAVALGGKTPEQIAKGQGNASHTRVSAIVDEMHKATRLLEGRAQPGDEVQVRTREAQLLDRVTKAKAKAAEAKEPEATESPPAPSAPGSRAVERTVSDDRKISEVTVTAKPFRGRELINLVKDEAGVNPEEVARAAEETTGKRKGALLGVLQEIAGGMDPNKGWLAHVAALNPRRYKTGEAPINAKEHDSLKKLVRRLADAAPEDAEASRGALDAFMNDINGKRLDARTQAAVHEYAQAMRRMRVLREGLADQEHEPDELAHEAEDGEEFHGPDADGDVSARSIGDFVGLDHELQAKLVHTEFAKAASVAKVGGVPFFEYLKSREGAFSSTRKVMEGLTKIADQMPGSQGAVIKRVSKLLAEHTPDLPMQFVGNLLHPKTGENILGYMHAGDNTIRVATNHSPAEILHTILHEVAHAATKYEIDHNQDSPFVRNLKMLHNEATMLAEEEFGEEGAKKIYGLTDVHEFVAETLSNPSFQALLSKLDTTTRKNLPPDHLANALAKRVINQGTAIIQRVYNAILDHFGLKDGAERSLLRDTLSSIEAVAGDQRRSHAELNSMSSAALYQRLAARQSGVPLKDGVDLEHAKDLAGLDIAPRKLPNEDKIPESLRPVARAFSHVSKTGAWDGLRRTVLAVMPEDHMTRRYARAFGHPDDPTNPVYGHEEVRATKQKINNQMLDPAHPVSEQWMRLSPESNRRVGQMMVDSSIWSIDPAKAKGDQLASVMASKNFDARYAHFKERWDAMSPEERSVFEGVRDYNEKAIRLHRRAAVDVAIKPFDDELTEVQKEQLRAARTPFEYDRLIGDDKPVDIPGLNEKLKASLKDLAGLNEIEGPYFHLGRDGHLVVQAKRDGTKVFQSRVDAEAFAKRVRDVSPDSTAAYVERGGQHVVDYKTNYVSMHGSKAEAEADAQRLRDQGFDVGPVTEKTLGDTTTPLSSGMKEIVAEAQRKIESHGADETTEALTASLRQAFLHLLAARSAYAGSKLARRGVAGVKPEEMRMNFARHAQALAWHTSNLSTIFDESQALAKLREAARKPEIGNADQKKMYDRGEYVNEIQRRTQQDIKNYGQSSATNSALAKIGFLNFLASPAHAAIWLTQNFTTGIPVAGARYGYGRATAEFTRAMGAPMRSGLAKSLKGLFSKPGDVTSSDVTSAILDAVRSHERYGKWARGNNSPMQQLLDRGAISSSFSNELSMMGKGDNETVAKAMEYARLLPHFADAVNRVSTALAGLELTRGDVRKTADLIKEVHVDYSFGNKPRAMKALGRNAQAIAMMKSYVLSMAHLYYGNVYDALTGSGMRRAEAVKTVVGMTVAAGLFTGVTGATPELAKWMVYAANQFFGDKDEYFDYNNTVRRWLSDALGKSAGRLAASGLPTALGMDVSGRMGLSDLLFHDAPDLRTITKDKAMQFLGSFLGPLPQMVIEEASSFARHMGNGEPAQALLSLVPLKALHDAQKAYELMDKGRVSSTGHTTMKPGEFTPADAAIQGIGFKPAKIGEVQGRQDAAYGYKEWANGRKAALIAHYVQAAPADRGEIQKQIAEWNSKNPGVRITRSDLLRSGRQGQNAAALAHGQATRDPVVNRLLNY